MAGLTDGSRRGGREGGKNRGNQTHAAAVMRACVGCLLYLGFGTEMGDGLALFETTTRGR